MLKILLLCFMVLVTGCVFDTENYAPVIEISTLEPIPKSGVHRVAYQETLYSIAWMYGLDYRDIAARNHLLPPYSVHEDQLIYLPYKRKPISRSKEKSTPKVATVKNTAVKEQEPTQSVAKWLPPANGPVIQRFSAQNKGINIGGALHDPIFASAKGKVVYSGNGLRGYGNLIIIKHNSTYLTAYAHNNQVFVQDGDWVQAGQKIAEMGNTGTTKVMLHFEIRRNGQPVNPAIYLASKK
jgi:lipoprotein NlpD